MTFNLSIITTGGLVFEGEVESLIATGQTGSFGILAHHAPMIVSLKPGPLLVKQNGQESYYAVSSGILEINARNNCLILADYARPTDSLTAAKNEATS